MRLGLSAAQPIRVRSFGPVTPEAGAAETAATYAKLLKLQRLRPLRI